MNNGLIYINKLLNGNKGFKEHQHTSWEIIYYTEGNGFVNANNTLYPFCSGTVICIPPNTPHSDIAEDAYQNIHLNMFSSLISHSQIYCFQDNSFNDLRQLLEFTYRVCIQKHPYWEELSQNLFTCIEQYIFSISQEQKSGTHPYAEIMAQRILENISNPQFQINSIFEDLFFTPDYLRRLFKNEYGCTPQHFLIKNRIELAAQLLRENAKVSEVSLMVGFTDVYYFSRVFKLETGLSPSAWVKQSSKNANEQQTGA